MPHQQVKFHEHRAAVAESAAAACARVSIPPSAAVADHAAPSASPNNKSCSEEAANALIISQLQQRLDKATRELTSERQRCEAAVSNSSQLQQRLDAALSMSCSASALSAAFEALLPPSPPRFNIELSQSPSPAPCLHAQLSQV
jgi:hypothetical protein